MRFKKVLASGHRTADLADDSTPVSTAEMGTLITQAIKYLLRLRGKVPEGRKGKFLFSYLEISPANRGQSI